MNNIFENRKNCVYRYLSFSDKCLNLTWIDALQIVDESNSFGLPEVMVLISPTLWYEELQIDYLRSDPRGNISFKSNTEIGKCNAIDFWGYDCPLQDPKTQIDHVFPWSRGGMTHSSNSIYLCELHNSLKSSDIHVYPWEKNHESLWLELIFKKLIMSASKLTKEILYFPKTQASRI